MATPITTPIVPLPTEPHSIATPPAPPPLPLSAALVQEQAHLVSYDENLLDRARTQWQFGDWQSLTRIGRDALQQHPERAKLALLIASAWLQQNQVDTARQFLRLAEDWGCNKKLICQILVAGVHNSLGRASAVTGLESRAQQHFASALAIGMPGSDIELLAQARSNEQFVQLGLPAQQWSPAAHLHLHATDNPGTTPPPHIPKRCMTDNRHDLGGAWSGNTVNTVIFRHHGILTNKNFQYTAFYADETTLRIVQRDLDSDLVSTHDITGQYKLRDAHNSISLGIDRAECLHISYDHHGSMLRYRRASLPNDITAWTDELGMTGAHENKVTYPTFILPHHDAGLMLLYRDGSYNNGSARLKSYDEASQTWTDHAQPILSGAEQKPWTSNAYWNHPALGSDGSLHLSFVWRTHALGEEKRINNINIGYARSPDSGLSWYSSNQQRYQLPITQVNGETIHPVAPGSNLINQSGMALDSNNHPHIVFYSNDVNQIPQYQHLRFDGKAWHHQVISNRSDAFGLHGGGTLQIPISRPEIVIDALNNAYVIYRGDLSNNRLVATCLPAPDYVWHPDNTMVLFEDDIGFAEPVIDRSRWIRDNILTLLVQYNEQPSNDINPQASRSPISLIDIRFK